MSGSIPCSEHEDQNRPEILKAERIRSVRLAKLETYAEFDLVFLVSFRDKYHPK